MPEDSDEAWKAIRRARVGLMMSHPYLAAAIARLPIIDASGRAWCQTCATDGYAIYVNTAFTATLGDGDLMFVMAHELVHCIVGHVDRRGNRDPFLWNVASDLATNALLAAHGFVPMPSALLDDAFASMTAEGIYDALLSRRPGGRAAGQSGRSSGRPTESGEGGGSSAGVPPPEVLVKTASGERVRIQRDGGGGWAPFDIHLDPESAVSADLRPSDFPTDLERRGLRKELVDSAARSAGIVAGRWTAELHAATTSPLQWQSLLSQFLSGLRRSDYRLFPPHRKHVHRGLYLPSLGVPGPRHIVVAIDTSASMTVELLSDSFSQVDHMRMATECAVTLIQFDTRIQEVLEIDPWEQLGAAALAGNGAKGRGGTDLRAPFEHIAADRDGRFNDLDALVVVTDGFGPVPDRGPAYPVLWVVTPGGRNRAGFGAEVVLPR